MNFRNMVKSRIAELLQQELETVGVMDAARHREDGQSMMTEVQMKKYMDAYQKEIKSIYARYARTGLEMPDPDWRTQNPDVVAKRD